MQREALPHLPISQSKKATQGIQRRPSRHHGRSAARRFLLLTLTVENCPISELRKTLADMGKAWKRLIRKPEFQIVRGWVRGTEVTKGKNGPMMAHPHFHALLLVPPSYFSGQAYVKQARWCELWREAGKLDYSPSVDIRRVKTPESGLSEAIKAATYSVKPSELTTDAAWFHELHIQVSGLRFLASGVVIRAALGDQAEGEAADIVEGAEPEGEESGKQVFGWNRPRRQYRRKPGYLEQGNGPLGATPKA